MRNRERLMGVAVILALLLVVKLGGQVYRWYAYEGERVAIHGLTGELRELGMEIVVTQLAADSLHLLIERMDGELEGARQRVESYGRRASGGELPTGVFNAYRGELSTYNRSVAERNAKFDRWQEVIARNHKAVRRFNELADSVRALAATMGEPYFSIPTPAEIASEAGLIAPPSP